MSVLHSVESTSPSTLAAMKCTAFHVVPSNQKNGRRRRLLLPSSEFPYRYVEKPANRTFHFQDF